MLLVRSDAVGLWPSNDGRDEVDVLEMERVLVWERERWSSRPGRCALKVSNPRVGPADLEYSVSFGWLEERCRSLDGKRKTGRGVWERRLESVSGGEGDVIVPVDTMTGR